MGYDVAYEGTIRISPPLEGPRRKYLRAFLSTWRRPRDVARLRPRDATREAVGLPLGAEGGFYVGGADHREDDRDDPTVLDAGRGPDGQPGVRCCLRLTRGGHRLEWDGCEKFGDAAAWLRYLLATFFVPWGHALEGELAWRGEDGEAGVLRLRDGLVSEEPGEAEDEVDAEVSGWIADLAADDVELRALAASQLSCAEGASPETVRAAVDALAGALDPPEVAVKALETLGGFGPAAAHVVDAVAAKLDDPSPFVRYWATFALGRMGPAARSALPALRRLAEGTEVGPRYGAIDAIARLAQG